MPPIISSDESAFQSDRSGTRFRLKLDSRQHYLRLPALELEIRALENALAALFTERNDIRARLDAHIYPVLTLPNEIISEIFLQYIPPHPSPLSDSSPIKLSQICSKWRYIAHGTPTLWQRIQLPDSAGYQRHFSPNCVSTVEAWLSRSAALPLSVVFGGFEYEGDWAAEAAKLWDVLVAQCARWKYAKLNLQNAGGWLHEPLSQIVEIDVRVPGTDPGGDSIEATAIAAPKLATAIVRDIYDFRILNFLPWAQLTALSLWQVSVSQAAAIVRLATSLVKCRLDMVDGENPLDNPVPPIILPELETMIFDFWDDWSDPQVLFLALRAPRLKNLAIFAAFSDEHPPAVLEELLKNREFSLERLLVVNVDGQEEEERHREVFAHIPHVELQKGPLVCVVTNGANEWEWWVYS